MGEMMEELSETVQKLAKTGQFFPAWFYIFKISSVPEQQKLIEQARRTPPLTYTPIILAALNEKISFKGGHTFQVCNCKSLQQILRHI